MRARRRRFQGTSGARALRGWNVTARRREEAAPFGTYGETDGRAEGHRADDMPERADRRDAPGQHPGTAGRDRLLRGGPAFRV